MARRGGAALASDEQMLFTRKGEVRVMSQCNARALDESAVLAKFALKNLECAKICPRSCASRVHRRRARRSAAVQQRCLISCGNATSKQAATMRRSRLRV